MSDNEIKIKASVEDDASKDLQKVGKSVDNLSKTADKTTKSFKEATKEINNSTNSFKSVKERADFAVTALKGLVLEGVHFAVTALKDLGKSIINAFNSFAEGEKVTNRLTAALKNQGIYSQYLLKDYENFAKEMRNYSGVADDIIKENMTLLTNYGLMGDELKRATNAAMNLSVGLGTDLKTATMMVAKAAEGNITAFSKYGITIQDTGDKAKNLELILKGVEDKFGDLAKANTDNLATQVAVLKENWEELKEELISGVVPAVNKIIKAFNELFTARDVKKENQYISDLVEERQSYYEMLDKKEKQYQEYKNIGEQNLARWQKHNMKVAEQAIKTAKEKIAAIDDEILRHKELKKSEKEQAEKAIADRQKELKAIKAKAEAEQKAAAEEEEKKRKREEAELKWKEELEKKKMDLQISSQQNVLNNIADLNKSASDYELAEKVNYYEKEYQAKIESLDRQIQAMQNAGQEETNNYALLLEQKKALDEEYQVFKDEEDKLIKEKGTALHDFNVWLTQDEVQKKIKSITALSALQNSKIKEVAALGKAAAIADTTISTYHMAVEAYEALAGIPGVGPALGIAAAAAATAYGLEQVANIAGVQFASGTDYVTSDMIAQVHQGEIIIPRTFSDAIRSGDLALTNSNFETETINNTERNNNNQTIVINLYVENNGNSIDELSETIRDTIAKNIAIGTMKPFPTREKM